MPILENLWIIPLLPLLGSAINGLLGEVAEQDRQCGRGRLDGPRFRAALEAVREFSTLSAEQIPYIKQYFTWIAAGTFPRRIRSPGRSTHRRDAAGRHRRRLAHPHLFHRIHGARERLLPLLLLPQSVHVFHAHPDPGRELRAALRRLGRRGPLQLPADRVLLPAENLPRTRARKPSSSTASATSASCSGCFCCSGPSARSTSCHCSPRLRRCPPDAMGQFGTLTDRLLAALHRRCR